MISIRLLDVFLSGVAIAVGLPLWLVIFLIGLLDTGSPFFTQIRVGANGKHFRLYKFRSMLPGIAVRESHLLDPSTITPFGSLLRRTKLDEVPQLLNVIIGDMSLVGPRPCLPSQVRVIEERWRRGLQHATPGLTGLSQILNVNMSHPSRLARLDAHMLNSISLSTYLWYICLTIPLVGDFMRFARREFLDSLRLLSEGR
jgi:O-antigen biosynthesis protein WbqP